MEESPHACWEKLSTDAPCGALGKGIESRAMILSREKWRAKWKKRKWNREMRQEIVLQY